MAAMYPVLIVDDDTELCEMLREYLQPEGFALDAVHDGETGTDMAIRGNYQAVVLDVMLPRRNGLDTLKSIRRTSRIPIIMLTARGEDIDRILGLEMGADDYLPKPFNPRELAARLRAILRRSDRDTGSGDCLTCGDLEVFPGSRRAVYRGEELDLTSTQYTILELLARQAGSPVSKETLSEKALGRKLSRYDRSIDMHISHLRKKLGQPDNEDCIQTVRGLGYQLVK